MGDIVTHLTNADKSATANARTRLAQVGLPGSIAAQQTGAGIPEEMWARISEVVQSQGGAYALRQLLQEVVAASERAVELMNALRKTMDEEVREDEAFRESNPTYNGVRMLLQCL